MYTSAISPNPHQILYARTRFASGVEAVVTDVAATTPLPETQQTETAKKKVLSTMSGSNDIPYSRFFIIGGMLAAGSMAVRGFIEGAIPWVWSYFTGL